MKIAGKGSVLSLSVAGIAIAVAQVISIELPEQKMETVETDTLDNAEAGVPHDPTGRTEGGEAGCELYLDPASHSFFTEWLNETDYDEMKKDCSIQFGGGASPPSWAFKAAGVSLGGKIAFNDYIKGTAKFKLDKLAS